MATPSAPLQARDDVPTICGISAVAAILTNLIHEGLGHGATALLTGAESGMLSSVAWSSEFDSRLVEAGGTLANLVAAALFWLVLRRTSRASVRLRFFLVIALAFNLFTGTGYFFFSGVTNFGDWAQVIAGLPSHAMWRTILVVLGIASYFAAVLVVGIALVRYAGVPRKDWPRLTRLTVIPYFSAVLVICIAGLLNPIGIQLVWQSALPATAGAKSGLLWLKYYIPKNAVPERPSDVIGRSYAWISLAVAVSLAFILALGRGIVLRRHWAG